MSYTTVKYRYRHRPDVPEKARATRHQLRERGRRRDVVNVIEKLLLEYLERHLEATVERKLAGRWAAFAFRLAMHGRAMDPEGDVWQIRRIWESY